MLKPTLESRPTWSAPKLEELGNLRTLVMVGEGRGKSGVKMDGGSGGGCEGRDNGACFPIGGGSGS